MLITQHDGVFYLFDWEQYPDECLLVWQRHWGPIALRRILGATHRGYEEGSWLSLLVVTGLTEDMIAKLWKAIPSGSNWHLDDRLKKDAGIE